MTDTARTDRSLIAAIRPYLEKEPIGALLLGLSSGAIGKLVDAGTVALSDKDS